MCLELGLNGLARGGTLNGLDSWRFLGRCPSRGLSKTGGHVENGSSHFHVSHPLKHGDLNANIESRQDRAHLPPQDGRWLPFPPRRGSFQP